jgi:hypothetical protein
MAFSLSMLLMNTMTCANAASRSGAPAFPSPMRLALEFHLRKDELETMTGPAAEWFRVGFAHGRRSGFAFVSTYIGRLGVLRAIWTKAAADG